MSRPVLPLLVAAAATVSVAGCGSSGDDTAAGARSHRPSAPASSAASPSAPSPSRTGPTLPAAADGTDIHACYDGRCEVRVRAPQRIPLSPKTGFAKLTVTSITAQGMRVDTVGTNGSTGQATVSAQGGGYAIATLNGLEIATLGVLDGVAVIRLSPAG
ncbi:hypothetical protein AB0I55_00470 [Actinocatenispora sera]|uniref:hypothetical protein n=1 Tax=Actinocatenispora sera TaxID=390989 RepID=UPI003405233A